MAISPLQVAVKLNYEDVARLLAGYEPEEDISAIQHGPEFYHQVGDLFAWKRVLVEAVSRGDLNAVSIMAYVPDPEVDRPRKSWETVDREIIDMFGTEDLRIQLERQEVVRWLGDRGVPEEEVPEELIGYPDQEAEKGHQDKPSHLLTIAILLELLKSSEKPRYNQEGIIKAIEEDPNNNEVRGISRSNLGSIFAEANQALKEARKQGS